MRQLKYFVFLVLVPLFACNKPTDCVCYDPKGEVILVTEMKGKRKQAKEACESSADWGDIVYCEMK